MCSDALLLQGNGSMCQEGDSSQKHACLPQRYHFASCVVCVFTVSVLHPSQGFSQSAKSAFSLILPPHDSVRALQANSINASLLEILSNSSKKGDLPNSRDSPGGTLQGVRVPLSTIRHGSRQSSAASKGLTTAIKSSNPSSAILCGQSKPRQNVDVAQTSSLDPRNEVSGQSCNTNSVNIHNCRDNLCRLRHLC